MAYLVVHQPDGTVARVPLKRPLEVGRGRGCDLIVHDIQASRRHCRFEPSPTGWKVIDLDSRNGTFVGGMPVRQLVLEDADEVRIGGALFRFYEGELASVRPAGPGEALAPYVGRRGAAEAADGSGEARARERPAVRAVPTPLPRPWGTDTAAVNDEPTASMGFGLSALTGREGRTNK